ncbi:hypothetical protein DAD186_20170 [Dermabacter vaginalis]|uniref:Uncharacterized protein n=1 Tax=Dermabacter vaginalis TaxID=1630135 RepID=A0A1B0ZKZ8_9MICO|nr:hypothetical protein DAD186_20170 [Dermabacter vaginalis]
MRASSPIGRDRLRITRTSVFEHAPETLARYLDTHAARTRIAIAGASGYDRRCGRCLGRG